MYSGDQSQECPPAVIALGLPGNY